MTKHRNPTMRMVRKFCTFCDAEHWHNQLKPPVVKDKPFEYRCTNCGHPRRFGNALNSMIRLVPGGALTVIPRG